MKKPKIIAWAAIAGGADNAAGKYLMSLGGSTKSAAAARKFTADHFAKSYPGVNMNVLQVCAIREGD